MTATRKGLFIYLGLFAFAAILFTAFPSVDPWASGLFYRDGFFLADDALLRGIYRAVFLVTDVLAIGLPLLLFTILLRKKPILGMDRRTAMFLIAALALGPGVAVNTILKDHWGRARPSQIETFGGTKQFTPALTPSDQCDRNCSFPAGHPAVGFYFVSFALLIAAPRLRRIAMGGAILAGALLGLMRMAQGGHFLSDVVFSGLIVFGISWLLHEFIVRRGGIAATGGAVRYALIAALCAGVAIFSMAFYDRPIALAMHAVDPRLHDAFEFITQFGLGKGYLIGSGALVVSLLIASRLAANPKLKIRCRDGAWRAGFIFASVALSGLLVDLLKVIFGRARPKLLFSEQLYGFTWHGGGGSDFWSFPSGHAATAAAMATALSLLWPRFWPAYWLAAALIFTSRIVIAAHYPSDVFAGAVIAVAVVWALRAGLSRAGIAVIDSP